jgi:cytochrome c
MNNGKKLNRLFLSRISAEACLGLGLAAVALGMMSYPMRSSAAPAAMTGEGEEKGDAKRGEQVYEKRCTGCHALDTDKEGPRLRGVFGKKAATLSSTFEYSEALKTSNVVWDAPSLDQWMKEPEKIVPKTDMFFRVPRASERADIIAYLQTVN